MRVGFLTGSLGQIGSGQMMVLPLARALRQLGCSTYGIELSRLGRHQVRVDEMVVISEPLAWHLAARPLETAKTIMRRRTAGAQAHQERKLDWYDQAAGKALVRLVERLQLDVLYAFHNINAAQVLQGWPHPSRILAVNLIGFGIDPSRGGAVDTFPLQDYLFEHPHWDLHIAATQFELDQYRQVYQKLGLDGERLLYLPHPYNELLFRPQANMARYAHPALGDGSKVLLYPVNVYPRKNIEMAVDVLALVNEQTDAHLVVTGRIWDRDYVRRLYQHAQQQGVKDRVHFLGGVALQEMASLYNQADLTVFTSHQETFGHGIVESLGSGTPVVGPGWIIPCREILDQSPGGWSSSKDAQVFASLVIRVLQSPPDSSQIAQAACIRYGSSSVAERFLSRLTGISKEKSQYSRTVRTTDWKALYCDAGDLL
ncbi:MAG: glycosyltransferase family 4 protein [Anaerolineae bacterium]|nr:glycosyltransferase family 4 protein [Anaerolineae bacterium]